MALYDERYGYQQSNVESGSFVSCIPEINEKYMTNEHMKEYYTIAEETSRVVPTLVKRDEKANDFYAEVKDVQPRCNCARHYFPESYRLQQRIKNTSR